MIPGSIPEPIVLYCLSKACPHRILNDVPLQTGQLRLGAYLSIEETILPNGTAADPA